MTTKLRTVACTSNRHNAPECLVLWLLKFSIICRQHCQWRFILPRHVRDVGVFPINSVFLNDAVLLVTWKMIQVAIDVKALRVLVNYLDKIFYYPDVLMPAMFLTLLHDGIIISLHMRNLS